MKWAFTTPVQFVIGWRFHVGAWRALRNGRCAVGTTLGTSCTSSWGSSTSIMVFFLEFVQVMDWGW